MGRTDGKVAIITGGARGLGASHARHLVAEGAAAIICDILDDEGKALADELGPRARYMHLDVTQPDQWQDVVATTVEEFGKLDVLVNNAGIVNGSTIQQFDPDKWREILDVNLTGTFLGIRAVTDAMIAAGGGSIMNVSSVEGLRGSPWAHGYVATKWAVRGLAKSVALELAQHNIRVNSLHPGLIRTPMTEGIPDDMVKIPLGRSADPGEVSTFVVFLASDESRYATGTEFVMDGGLVADVPHK
ncbi:glucose 1-dehydrogenase [Haloechinothrix sp. YIM 98757]|uniref:Glucose 1-dehydrogenase n=1 Tax=Haloechinothrix aidingensis TaxID=2752311 RepID=A0A838ACG9_9PSEU|nr:glucose 1-dehydrogenase [Haloechinothrix aidingensis]MBA0126940.1 glucose 1-dehydrogenase [Haloechinothrix aidingensis]